MIAAGTPPRMILVNVRTGEEKTVLRNPLRPIQDITVNYNRMGSPGLSHQPLQYSNTGNATFPDMQFFISKYSAVKSGLLNDPDILDFERFLLSFTAPSEMGQGILGGAPPRILLIWPAPVFSVECVVTKLRFEYQRFATRTAELLRYVATVSFEEIRDERLTSEDLRVMGSKRATMSGAEITFSPIVL